MPCDVVGARLKIGVKPVELDPLILFCAPLVVDLPPNMVREQNENLRRLFRVNHQSHTHMDQASIMLTNFIDTGREAKNSDRHDFGLREPKFGSSSPEIAAASRARTFCVWCVRYSESFIFCSAAQHARAFKHFHTHTAMCARRGCLRDRGGIGS